MIDEQWKDIFDGEYSVSNTGKVATLKSGWALLRPRDDGNGYPSVTLRKPGVRKQPKVYALVARAFLGPKPSPAHQVNHKDGDKWNSRVDNLEWCTQSENQLHRYRVLGKRMKQGATRGYAKLNEQAVRGILALKGSGLLQREIGARFGVSQAIVSEVFSRKIWQWVKDA